MFLVININTGYYYSAHKVKRPIKSILLTLAALVKLSIAARQPGIDHRAQHRAPCGGLKYRIPAPCDIEIQPETKTEALEASAASVLVTPINKPD